MSANISETRTFDALIHTDLGKVYDRGKEEDLRDRAFRILLKRADSVDKLEKLVFEGESGLDRWTTKELIEILNHFRLLSSPKNQIRLYRQCRDETFRNAPRVRDLYVLALNRSGMPAEAIREASRIIAEGRQNALLWGTLGESYSARMLFAEKLAKALRASGDDFSLLDRALISQCHDYFPEVDIADMTIAFARALRHENLVSAKRIFRRGFRESGSSFTGLGWMLRTVDQLAELVAERDRLKKEGDRSVLDADQALQLRLMDNEVSTVEEEFDRQAGLIGIALELQGGSESLDYWTHAGRLLVAVVRGADPSEIQNILSRVFAAVDADFKFEVTLAELRRIRDQYVTMREIKSRHGQNTILLDTVINHAEFVIAEFEAGRARFKAAGWAIGGALSEKDHQKIKSQPADAATAFLKKTINFRALVGNLVPLHIHGGIGRAGSRVPDLVINRQVQEDLADLVETKVSQVLNPNDRDNPRAVIARIQKVVGAGFKIEELQDLQSPAHVDFDIRSDGLIALSGVDPDMRKETRSGTDLTASLLMQNGDCRETMYLNGTLFACWQQTQVKNRIAKAMLCLELGFREGFQTIVSKEIPQLMRYQLRGGQVAVYVDSVGLPTNCQQDRSAAHDSMILAEKHAMTFLYDTELKTAELCDGFYNESLFDSPYEFGSGPINLEEIRANGGLIRARSTVMMCPDGSKLRCPVYLEFRPYSKTDYESALDECDIPNTTRFMGRTFNCDLKRERRRLEEGTSPIPALLKKVHAWQLDRRKSGTPDPGNSERQLAKLILDLARHQPELVQMKEVTIGQPLIVEDTKDENIYLVLSGQMHVYRNGQILRDPHGSPVKVSAGSILGEISALRGGVASATVKGNAVVLTISKAIIRHQLTRNSEFRQTITEVASHRVEQLNQTASTTNNE